MSSRRIAIFDTTLRDGEQSPGIALRPDEKAEAARMLERLGVDVIEAGFAASSPGDFEGVRAAAAAVERVTVASLCRTLTTDIEAGAEAVRGAPRSRLHIFIATSPVHMEKKLGLEPREVVEHASRAVAYAREVDYWVDDEEGWPVKAMYSATGDGRLDLTAKLTDDNDPSVVVTPPAP